MQNFFKNCKSLDEAKKLYKDLALKFHPDRGGDLETMKAINIQYEIAAKSLKYKTNSDAQGNETDNSDHQPEAFIKIIDALINFQHIKIEIVGSWIWITGETKEIKDTLKGLKFLWASKKMAWFFREDQNKSKNRKAMSLDDIRAKYGSTTINKKSYKQLA